MTTHCYDSHDPRLNTVLADLQDRNEALEQEVARLRKFLLTLKQEVLTPGSELWFQARAALAESATYAKEPK